MTVSGDWLLRCCDGFPWRSFPYLSFLDSSHESPYFCQETLRILPRDPPGGCGAHYLQESPS